MALQEKIKLTAFISLVEKRINLYDALHNYAFEIIFLHLINCENIILFV